MLCIDDWGRNLAVPETGGEVAMPKTYVCDVCLSEIAGEPLVVSVERGEYAILTRRVSYLCAVCEDAIPRDYRVLLEGVAPREKAGAK